MSFVTAATDFIVNAAQDIAGVGTQVSATNAAAAAATTEILSAGADEVSQAIAAPFDTHAMQYQSFSAQVAAFHQNFVQIRRASGAAYAATEATNTSPWQALVSEISGALNAPTQALFGRPPIGEGAVSGVAGAPGRILADPGRTLNFNVSTASAAFASSTWATPAGRAVWACSIPTPVTA
ncbi:PE family protein [Mycobacterium camsae]|uniref:PE family protein n=1 Tax=Mycobacterium gordonae TaxID=1778 RepID=UPI00197DB8BE|nr:PE family protein [Mycobacterium gordonae]